MSLHWQGNRAVESILLDSSGAAEGVTLTDGTQMRAHTVLVNADPFALQKLAGEQNFPDHFNSFIDGLRRDGSTMKVNLALRDLPTFTCLPERVGQHCSTTHLLPDEDVVIESLTKVRWCMSHPACACTGELTIFVNAIHPIR